MEIRSEAEKVDDTNFSGIPFAEGGRRPVLPVCLRNMKTGINEVLEYTVAHYYNGPVIVENPPDHYRISGGVQMCNTKYSTTKI